MTPALTFILFFAASLFVAMLIGIWIGWSLPRTTGEAGRRRRNGPLRYWRGR